MDNIYNNKYNNSKNQIKSNSLEKKSSNIKSKSNSNFDEDSLLSYSKSPKKDPLKSQEDNSYIGNYEIENDNYNENRGVTKKNKKVFLNKYNNEIIVKLN